MTDLSHKIDTFVDLYKFLQNHKENDIIGWLNVPWVGKDKQESLLRLFAGLGLIEKLKSFDICKGNFNKNTITKNKSIKDLFLNKKNLINLKDKGDASDLTGLSKNNPKHLLLTTSKNLNKTQVGKLDIDKILTNFEKYKVQDYTMSLCICIRDNRSFQTTIKSIEETNKELKNLLEKEDTIIIDWKDLNQAYHQFKRNFVNKSLNSIIKSNKPTMCLKMHQHLGVMKTLRMKKDGKKKILWGHIQRSGKSYIIGGCIIEDSNLKENCNYLVITTAPNETIEQQTKVFDCIQLEDFNVVCLNGDNKKPVLKRKNIVICSKQFLQTKLEGKKSITWLKKIDFDMRFIDESHNGGTTELAQKTLNNYGKNSFTVQITATYSKPINDYNIPKDNWILWDLEDIKLCKNIDKKDSIDSLVKKHGEGTSDIAKSAGSREGTSDIREIISKYSLNNIIEEYSKYPELWLLTDEINPEIVSDIISETRDNHYGWSSEACFLLKQGSDEINDQFQNESENLKMWYRIFGKRGKFDIPDKEYPDKIVFMKRIEKICKNPSINSRFIGEGDFHNEPMIIMAFLPQNNIDKISKATIRLLEKNNLIPDYDIISINSKTTNDPKQTIEDARIKARNSSKKGVLVLSGRQCSLGVSIHNCDIVLLLNNNRSFDMIYQMMFRCMTEGKNKKSGFVIDLNIHRVIETSIINYASLIKSDIHPREATKYILQERLINLNGDHYMPTFGNDISKIDTLCENVYEIYSSNTENALNYFLNRLRFKEILLTKEEQKIFKDMFSNSSPTRKEKESVDKLLEEEKIKKGIEKTKIDKEKDEVEKEDQINYMDILKHIIPLICLLTIRNEKTSFVEMFNSIEEDEYIYGILMDQIKSWWGEKINEITIKKFIQVYIKYMKEDKETNQIIRTVKELFRKNINNRKELSQLVDKYLIPQELEKKSNAEVSTPFKLRQEMLDKIPLEFWKEKRKVFEPCSGKGGFLIDIIDRFMIGLEDKIKDEKERYKKIVQECLYFSDINPTNIFICKLLIDPYNEYKLNYNEGNTLELNIKEKWGIDGFDAVIGNPPYQNQQESKGKRGGGDSLWNKFVIKSLDLLKGKGYLSFIHPSGWRKPESEKSKYKNMFELMTKENQLHYLEIHNTNDGMKIFKCGTRYDWYVIQKTQKYKYSTIVGDDNIEYKINMDNWEFLPNSKFKLIKKLLKKNNEEKCEIIFSNSSYETRKKWMSKVENTEFKYPCIHSTPKNGIRYYYSSCNDKGHFGIPKVIFGESGIYNAIIDIDGIYGMTQGAMAIVIDNKEEGINIKKAIESKEFKNILESCSWSNFRIDWRMFKYFKKNFWKEFI